MAYHKDLTGVDLHEPKGADAAATGSVYVSDGAGSGAWTVLDIPEGTFLVQIARFTASGTWTKPANTFLVRVYAQGGGGAMGGGGDGGDTTFGAHLTATGGGKDAGSSGDLNIEETGTSAQPRFIGPYFIVNGEVDTGAADFATWLSNAGYNGNWATETFEAADLGSTESIAIGAGAGSAESGHVVVESYILI